MGIKVNGNFFSVRKTKRWLRKINIISNYFTDFMIIKLRYGLEIEWKWSRKRGKIAVNFLWMKWKRESEIRLNMNPFCTRVWSISFRSNEIVWWICARSNHEKPFLFYSSYVMYGKWTKRFVQNWAIFQERDMTLNILRTYICHIKWKS